MTGLQFDLRAMQKSYERKFSRVTADAFRPEVARFTKRTLQTAIRLTPIRSLATIAAAQRKQYASRINYITSIHELIDPTLIVKDGVEWLYANGRWWAASYWNLPAEIETIHQELLSERDRRLQTSEGDFIAARAQARFLYQRSWWQAGQSLGINVTGVMPEIIASHSRHNPPEDPPKAYGQWRGGKYILSVVIVNPFLEQESKYKPFSGKDILAQATAQNTPAFLSEVESKLERLIA